MDINFRMDELALLGLKDSEKKVILAISKIAKPIALIARHTGIPRTSILYMLKKLEKKEYVRQIEHGKGRVWRSNVDKILLYIKNLQKMKKK